MSLLLGYRELISSVAFVTDYFIKRHEPIGYDSKKNAYWLIGGMSLGIVGESSTHSRYQRIVSGYKGYRPSPQRV